MDVPCAACDGLDRCTKMDVELCPALSRFLEAAANSGDQVRAEVFDEVIDKCDNVVTGY